jgi:hypothetical protein
MRDQIWALLNDAKFKSYCLNFLVYRYQKWDRNINIFLALASSGSIAAWAIWQVNPIIWGVIIAISQILTVIKPYFPYFKYVKELNDKSTKVDIVNIELEELWYKLQNAKISNDEAGNEYFTIKKKLSDILSFTDDTIINVDKKIERKANERMKVYLRNNYQSLIDINT